MIDLRSFRISSSEPLRDCEFSNGRERGVLGRALVIPGFHRATRPA